MWDSLNNLQRVFFVIAVPFTIFLIIQTLMIFVGFDSEDASCDTCDSNGESDGLITFILRGIIAFFTLGGWTGFAFASMQSNDVLTVVMAIVFGGLGFAGMFFLVSSIVKMQGEGNIALANSIGKTGKVYLTIPPKRSGMGKITLNVQERYIELNALTESEVAIKNDEIVKVTSLVDSSVVLVERV